MSELPKMFFIIKMETLVLGIDILTGKRKENGMYIKNGKIVKSYNWDWKPNAKDLNNIKRNSMKNYLLLFMLILVSCNKSYNSPYGYNIIKLYEYNGKPWDNNATHNKIYNSHGSDISLYSKIEKLNYGLKKSFMTNQKIDSLLFRGNMRNICRDHSALLVIIEFFYYMKILN